MRFIEGIALLEKNDDFPDPILARKDQPLAIGFELTPSLMLAGYKKGIFAWSVDPVTWWSPTPRAIFNLNQFHVSKSLAKKIKKTPFKVTIDHSFADVVYNCSLPRKPGDEIWITEEFISAFVDLYNMGYAHSIECWQDDELVGGVFGVAINGFFSAESMFSTATDASKIALYYLLQLMQDLNFSLFDIQILTEHTASLGAIAIPRRYYLDKLKFAINSKTDKLVPQIIIDK